MRRNAPCREIRSPGRAGWRRRNPPGRRRAVHSPGRSPVPEVLLHRHREIGPALDRGVIRDDDAFTSGDTADAGDNSGGWGFAPVEIPGAQRPPTSRKGLPGIQQPIHTLARKELSTCDMPIPGPLAASLRGLGQRSRSSSTSARNALSLARNSSRACRYGAADHTHAVFSKNSRPIR